jgi:hypothetical protein
MARIVGLLTLVSLLGGCAFDVDGIGSTGLPPTNSDPVVTDDLADPSAPPATDAGVADDLSTPPAAPVAQGAIGDACDDAAHKCGAFLTCLRKLGTGPKAIDFAGGYCTRSCTSAACPGGSACTDFGNNVKYCLADCKVDVCRTGYACCDIGSNDKVCKPGSCE